MEGVGQTECGDALRAQVMMTDFLQRWKVRWTRREKMQGRDGIGCRGGVVWYSTEVWERLLPALGQGHGEPGRCSEYGRGQR